MHWWGAIVTANLIGIGSNIDNCGVGIAYGTKNIQIPRLSNAIINSVGCCTALLGAYAGQVISQVLTANQAAWTACIVLVCIGLLFWYTAYVHPRLSRRTTSVPINKPGWRQAVALGLTLSFTNVASGFGATVSSATTIWAVVGSITLWGYAMIAFGNVLGIRILSKLFGNYASFVAGLLMILVGIHQVAV